MPAATVAVAPLATSCHDITAALCAEVERAALAAVASSGWTATRVWIGPWLLCPMESCLFELSMPYPVPQPPAGGTWVASVEVAFAETAKHAGVHVAQVGSEMVPVLIGYRVPPPEWVPAGGQ